ncbi:MAG: hypothetical protein GX571_08295, partial [Lentisphaerae bacterium]|nr:hypothetical protein [Lentisphaerota bacterium]
MKQIVATTAAVALGVLLAGQGYAQEIPPNGPFGGGPGAAPRERRERQPGERAGFSRGGAGMQNEMLFRMLQDPQVVKEIGLSDEKSAALKEAFRKVQEKQIDLQAALDKLNLQQTGQIAGLLGDRGKKADEAIKLVEEMGKINTELSKLAIERILAVREHLTDDQIKKAREVGEARMTRMRENIRNRQGGEGGR